MRLKDIDLKGKKAIFIDCDGTLGDTMPAHNMAYKLAFLLNDVPFDKVEHEKWAPYGGTVLMKETVVKKGYEEKVDDIIRDKQRLLDICLDKLMRHNEELIDFIINRPRETHAYVVTNGRRNSITKVLNNLGLTYHVDGLIPIELVREAKPSPEPYNYALVVTSLNLQENVAPDEVIVFEDNEIGVNSAKAAGIKDIVKVNTEDFTHEKI